MSFNKRFARARHELAGDKVHDQLTIKHRDSLTVIEHVDENWVRCTNQAGERGLVPLSYLDFDEPSLARSHVTWGESDDGGRSYSHQPQGTDNLAPPLPLTDPDSATEAVAETSMAALQSAYDQLYHALTIRSAEVARLEKELDEKDRALLHAKSQIPPAKPPRSLDRSHSVHERGAGGGHRGVSPRAGDPDLPPMILSQHTNDEHRQLLALKEDEMSRLNLELAEKDQLLDELQMAVKESVARSDELLEESRTIATKTEDMLRSRLDEKDKQLTILQVCRNTCWVAHPPGPLLPHLCSLT